jgi:hypothetical protein
MQGFIKVNNQTIGLRARYWVRLEEKLRCSRLGDALFTQWTWVGAKSESGAWMTSRFWNLDEAADRWTGFKVLLNNSALV